MSDIVIIIRRERCDEKATASAIVTDEHGSEVLKVALDHFEMTPDGDAKAIWTLGLTIDFSEAA